MNDAERRMWVENDEGLYNWRKSLFLSVTAFIKEYREEIDREIERQLDQKPMD